MASRRSVSIVRLVSLHLQPLPLAACASLAFNHSRRRACEVHSASHLRRSMTTAAARGCFIVLEGLDRSGKTTQCKLLTERLNRKQETEEEKKEAVSGADRSGCVQLRFPDRSTAIGGMLDAYLRQTKELDDHAVHLLFAANRWERQQSIASLLASGLHVVVDRYSCSGAAFSAAKGLDPAFCWQSEVGLPAPDLTVFLSISAADAQQRGGYGAERYENKEMQERVRQQFARIRQQEEQRGRRWVEVEAGKGKTVDSVAEEIAAIAEDSIRRLQSSPLPLQHLT